MDARQRTSCPLRHDGDAAITVLSIIIPAHDEAALIAVTCNAGAAAPHGERLLFPDADMLVNADVLAAAMAALDRGENVADLDWHVACLRAWVHPIWRGTS